MQMQLLIYDLKFNQSLLSPLSSPLLFKTKKGGSVVFVWHFYGRFLSINTVAMAIAMIMAIATTAMYVIRSAVVARFA